MRLRKVKETDLGQHSKKVAELESESSQSSASLCPETFSNLTHASAVLYWADFLYLGSQCQCHLYRKA